MYQLTPSGLAKAIWYHQHKAIRAHDLALFIKLQHLFQRQIARTWETDTAAHEPEAFKCRC